MILVVDNYDSFTYNLVQYLGELGAEPLVRRNDAITVDEVRELAPRAIVLSPGPGIPSDAGITVDTVRQLGASTPILGVCLGHQAIGEAYGGRTVRAERPMHGKTSRIVHRHDPLFEHVPESFEVMRYHSLVIEAASLPAELVVIATAQSDPAEIHGVRHRTHPVWGVQFHPESIGTPHGKQMLRNFIGLVS